MSAISQARPPGRLTPWEIAVAASLATVVLLGGLLWLWGGVAGLLFGQRWPNASLAEIGRVVWRLPSRLDDPAAAWPSSVARELPGATGFYIALALLLVLLAALAMLVVRLWRRHGPSRAASRSRRASTATWARG